MIATNPMPTYLHYGLTTERIVTWKTTLLVHYMLLPTRPLIFPELVKLIFAHVLDNGHCLGPGPIIKQL